MTPNLLDSKDLFIGFWKWFVNNQAYIHKNLENDKESILDQLNSRLKEIDENLTFEISDQKTEENRELVISADGIADSFDNVIKLYRAAPSIENWTIIPFRPRMNSNNIQIKMGDIALDYDDIYFVYEHQGHYIDLNVYMKYEEESQGLYIHMYFILLDSLIGEYDAVSKIGNTEFMSLNTQSEPGLKRFNELIHLIDSLEDR